MKRCRRYRLWKLRGRINRCGRVWTKHISACTLLKRINSSCSSGYERRKSVSGMKGRLIAAAEQGNLEMVKYCVANKCPIDEERVHMLPKTVISRYSNTYAKKSKRLGIRVLPIGRLQMVISTYSNILLSVNMINMTKLRVRMRPRTAT